MGVPELEEYKFGFHDDVEPVFSTGEGLTEEVIREMSRIKGEPEWMLEFRLKSLETFNKMPMPNMGPRPFRHRFRCHQILPKTK